VNELPDRQTFDVPLDKVEVVLRVAECVGREANGMLARNVELLVGHVDANDTTAWPDLGREGSWCVCVCVHCAPFHK
jgi:hypothetical protein